MDAIGNLDLSWVQGYNGSKASYIDNDVICYICGNNVKFVAEDGAETSFNFKGQGVGPFAVHGINKAFAIAEQCLDPKIYVFVYPTFRQAGVLEGGAKLEYSNLAFSSSEYLASVSGVPEFELTLWKYTSSTKLCSVKISSNPITSFAFNPGNWRNICITNEKEISVWQTEQCNDKFVLLKQSVKLPPEDSNSLFEDEKDKDNAPTRASTRMTRYTIDVPKAAVAGLVGEIAERLDEIQDLTPRVVPASQAWTPSGDILIGCRGGQLIKIDGEVFKAKVLYYPPPRAQTPYSRVGSAYSLKQDSSADIQPVADDVSQMVLEGSLDCIALHRYGLYAAGQDGVLRLIDMKGEEFKVLEQCPVGVPVSSLGFSVNYRRIVLGSTQGSLHLYEPGAPESLRQLRNLHAGNFVGIGCLAGSEYCVTCREDGEVQLWTLEKGHLVSSISVGIQATSLAAGPLLHAAAVGTISGHVFYVDFTDVDSPRIIHGTRLYQGPVTHLAYDTDGKYLFSASDDGHVFVIDSRATKQFTPLAYTTVGGDIQSLSTTTEGETIKLAVTINTTGNKRNGTTNVVCFEISDDMMKDLKNHVRSLKGELKDASIKKIDFKLAIPSYGAVLADGNMYTMSQYSKKLDQIPLPEDTTGKSKNEPLYPDAEFISHQLPGGKLQFSPHGKWLASCGTDGAVQLRALGTLDRFVSISPHDYRSGGVRFVAFSEDSQSIFTTGYDGVLTCYSWHFSSTGIGKAKSAMESARARKTRLMHLQKEEDEALKGMSLYTPPTSLSRPVSGLNEADEKERQAKEKAIEADEIYTTPTPVPPSDSTWLQVQTITAVKEEDKEYSDTKRDLREQIREMRRTLQGMLKQNEDLPEIEKLGRHEFDLDIEEQNKLQAEADSEVQRVRDEIEFDNLAKIYLREMIKKECWDDMKVKGRAIQAFNSILEVSNFPMRQRSESFEKLLATVTARRKLEKMELAARKLEVEMTHKPATTTAEGDNLEDEEVEEGGKEKPSTTGSLGVNYGGDNELFISQFELHSREQKTQQIVLLEDAIFRIKNIFNKEFDDVFLKKEQEIAKIKDKNKRIVKIMADLELCEDMVEPTMSILEKPERLLTVEDHEVKVEKYLTPEQRKKKEDEEKAEEERRLREKGDNARERALDMMMGGVLEIKKEDELKKDIPKPTFMLTKKEEDWSEDEQKLVKEYEKKVKDLQEEREKYHKQLETELRKLQQAIKDGMANFDDILNQLFLKKIKIMMVIYQEELKILRIRYSLLMEEELETQDKELARLMEHKKQMKAITAHAMMESRKNVDAFREQYDILVAEDKVMDRSFKREFHDVTALQQDQLYRLFRKKPRVPRLMTQQDSGLPNPFAERPSTARQNNQAKQALDQAIQEMDKEVNCPEGLETDVWERFCSYRREKIENDQLMKQKALTLSEMEAFLKKRVDEDEQLKNEIDGISDTQNKLKEDRQRFNLNLEVQLLLKQGQVEVDSGAFIHDYKDSALLHRSVVEELNNNIKQLGESKIASMVESKDFRMGIIQLEWEHKKMLMNIEDFMNKMKDIQFMKVTREIQLYLNNAEQYDAKKQEEVSKLEQTILTKLKHHERKVHEKKKIIKELKKKSKHQSSENNQLETEQTELNVSVNERKHIDEVNAERRMDTGAEKRYQEIVQRRKLVDLAKAQAQEVAVLRAEVERLRMRTFPALVQVEH